MKRRTPLAWKNLTHDPRRLVVAIAGIAFAVVLMFMQRGFENALFDSTVKIIHDLNADVVIVSKAQYALPAQQRFDRKRLVRASGVEGVTAVHPIYIETFAANLRSGHRKGYPIRVIGCTPGEGVMRVAAFDEMQSELRRPGTALVDVRSKGKFAIPSSGDALTTHPFELADKKLSMVGTFRMGTDFANDGNLLMSAENFAEYFSFRNPGGDPLDLVDIGVVQIEASQDAKIVAARLRQSLPSDVLVFTKQEFIDTETQFWSESTPIAYVFAVGTIMGFIVGVIICYQIIYSGVADYLPEFATLKAMGYSDRYFIQLVLAKSFYLSIFGFLPGLAVSFGLYQLLSEATGLLLNLTILQAIFVYLLTLAMCCVSGLLAMRKVLAADPADLF